MPGHSATKMFLLQNCTVINDQADPSSFVSTFVSVISTFVSVVVASSDLSSTSETLSSTEAFPSDSTW